MPGDNWQYFVRPKLFLQSERENNGREENWQSSTYSRLEYLYWAVAPCRSVAKFVHMLTLTTITQHTSIKYNCTHRDSAILSLKIMIVLNAQKAVPTFWNAASAVFPSHNINISPRVVCTRNRECAMRDEIRRDDKKLFKLHIIIIVIPTFRTWRRLRKCSRISGACALFGSFLWAPLPCQCVSSTRCWDEKLSAYSSHFA